MFKVCQGSLRKQWCIKDTVKHDEVTLGIYSMTTHPGFTCSKLTIEALEQGVKYVQS